MPKEAILKFTFTILLNIFVNSILARIIDKNL